MIPTARAMMPAMRPKRWRVTLLVVDTPGPGEDYLTKEDLLANVLQRKLHSGVAVVHEEADEDPVPVVPEPLELDAEVMWPADPVPALPDPARRSVWDRLRGKR